jgi:hypothetical protein
MKRLKAAISALKKRVREKPIRREFRNESSAMFAKSPGDVVPKTRKGIGVKKTMVTISCTNMKLLIASDLPKARKYNKDDFFSDIHSELEQEK